MTIYGFHKLTSTLKSMETVGSDERYFEGLLTVQMKDKQGEITIVDELYKVLPIWIDRGAPISDTHSNRIVGKGINYSRTTVKNEQGEELPAIKITGKIFKNYELDNVIWEKIKSKEYQGLSFGGATRSARSPIKMKDGSIAYALSDLEHYEVAVCKDPAVPMAIITDFNQIAKSTFNSFDRGDGKMVIQCDNMGCYVNKENEIKIQDPLDGENDETVMIKNGKIISTGGNKQLEAEKNKTRFSGKEYNQGEETTQITKVPNSEEDEERKIGMRVETEFTEDRKEAEEAVENHLKKDPKHYSRLRNVLRADEDKPLNKPMRDDGNKKFKVYVKDPNTGKIVIVRFGDPNMEIKRDDPERRASFRARHDCDNAKDITTPKYWSCKMWEKGTSVTDQIDKTDSEKEQKDFADIEEREGKKLGSGKDVDNSLLHKAGYKVDTEDRTNGMQLNDTVREKQQFNNIKGSKFEQLPFVKANLNESQTFEEKVQALIAEGKSRESAEKIVGSFVHKEEGGSALSTSTAGAFNAVASTKRKPKIKIKADEEDDEDTDIELYPASGDISNTGIGMDRVHSQNKSISVRKINKLHGIMKINKIIMDLNKILLVDKKGKYYPPFASKPRNRVLDRRDVSWRNDYSPSHFEAVRAGANHVMRLGSHGARPPNEMKDDERWYNVQDTQRNRKTDPKTDPRVRKKDPVKTLPKTQ